MGGRESGKGIQHSTVVVGILSALGERCGVPCRVYSRESEFVDSSDHDIVQPWDLERSRGSKRNPLPVTAARVYHDGCGREPMWRSPEVGCESASSVSVGTMRRECFPVVEFAWKKG